MPGQPDIGQATAGLCQLQWPGLCQHRRQQLVTDQSSAPSVCWLAFKQHQTFQHRWQATAGLRHLRHLRHRLPCWSTDSISRLCAVQMEDERRRQQPPSEMEVIRRAERDAHTAKASAALQEQRDEVKAMNAMLAYAKCAAIR